MARRANDPAVLIGVLKDRRDLERVRAGGWYRIPLGRAPRRPFAWLAFYQPAAFGAEGRCIRWCAPVVETVTAKRRAFVPEEPDHPRADDAYRGCRVGRLLRLPRPVRNVPPRRVTFAFTTLRRLFGARDLFGVFHAAPVEPVMDAALRRAGVPALPEFTVTTAGGRRFRLDFAVFCARGALAVECDADAWHGRPAQRRKDRARDAALRRHGWTVLRLREDEVMRNSGGCARRVRAAVRRLS